MTIKYIFTRSAAYSGSTLLDMLIGAAIKNCASAGETHALVHQYKQITERITSIEDRNSCIACKWNGKIETCPIDPIAIKGFNWQIKPEDLYEELRIALNVDYLHTSDKRLPHLEKFVPTHKSECAVIVLWKHPLRQYASSKYHHPTLTPMKYSVAWNSAYREIESYGKRQVVVSYENLCLDTHNQLKRIAKKLNLPFNANWSDTWEQIDRIHRVHGNWRAQRSVLDGKGVFLDNKYLKIPHSQRVEIEGYFKHLPGNKWEELQERSK